MEIGVKLGKKPKSIGGREHGNEEEKTQGTLVTDPGGVGTEVYRKRSVKKIVQEEPTDPDGDRYRGTPVSVGGADSRLY